MKRFISFLLVFIVLISLNANSFEKSTPEAQGVSSQAILEFIEAAEVDALHSFMLIRHGKLIAQGWWAPYEQDSPHMLYSLSKSFTSTAIGLAVAEGLLSLNDTVISFFPDETPAEPSNNLKAMRIRDLLAMNTGHQDDTTNRITTQPGKTWVQAFLALDVEHKPGTHFVYNSGATYMLSAILQKVTGETVLDFLTPPLFQPLGIENPTWETSPSGINTGGWGLKVKTEDIAKLGQLYLQKGMWDRKRILTEEWVEAATSKQSSNGSNPDSDWEQGYGYQFWRARHNIYRGDGAFGQYCIVMPDYDAVLAITSGLSDMQKPMNLAWDILLPAMHEEAMPADEESLKKLQSKLENLQLKTVEGEKSSKVGKKISGKTFVFESNQMGMQSVTFDAKKNTFTVKMAQGERVHSPGYGEWISTEMPFMSMQPEPVAACGAWVTPEHYQMKVAATETPYIQTIDFKFTKEEVEFGLKFNVGFNGSQAMTLKGKIQ